MSAHTQQIAIPENVRARFWRLVKRCGADACWPWLGGHGHCGHGLFWLGMNGRKQVVATHVSIAIATGEWPAQGMYVCHRCDNPPCVNPTHLFVGSQRDNIRDAFAKKRIPPRGKSYCKYGHEFTPENTRLERDGFKECITCRRRNLREAARRRRARARLAQQESVCA